MQTWPFESLIPLAYDMLMVDPPWTFKLRSAKGRRKAAVAQYRTMSDEEILDLPIGQLASPNAVLWLWATSPKLRFCMAALEHWGFRYKAFGAWDKHCWGTGYIIRSLAEPFLIGTIGEPRIQGTKIPNLIRESRREHSRKPERAYEFAEAMLPHARRADVFARQRRVGWEGFGDELDKFEAA